MPVSDNDLVRRGDAWNAASIASDDFYGTNPKRDAYMHSVMNQIPAISPDEVRGVGEWEHQELAPTNWTFCSVCGRQRSKKYKWYYCPNCGAKTEVTSDA